jgi:PncC family amidohydrolase
MKPQFFDVMILNQLTLSSVESVTGGLFAHSITKHPKASQFYVGGFVVYNDDVKHRLTDVKLNTLHQFSAISKEVAVELANNTLTKTNSDICISLVGNAGPTAQGDQPVGHMITAIVSKNDLMVYHDDLNNTRIKNQKELVRLANERLLAFIQHISSK